MRTAAVLAHAQLRRGWRSLVGLTLLIGLVGGLVLGGLAAAERTRTAIDRMIDAKAASDIVVNPDDGDESALDFDQVEALSMVAEFSRAHGVSIFGVGPFESIEELYGGPFVMASDGGLLRSIDRPVMVDGHIPDPDSLEEVYLDSVFAEANDLHVGDEVHWQTFPPEALGEAFEAFEAGDMQAGFAVLNEPGAGHALDLSVAGIGTGLDGVAVDEGYEPAAAWIGPALYASLGEPSAGYGGAAVRLTDPGRQAEFKAAVDAMVPDELIVYQTQAVTRAKALRATQPAAAALTIFAAITTVLGLLVIGQAISRRFQLDARDNTTLAALGTTTGERFGAAMIRLSLTAIAGVALGVVVAAALSLLTPVGPAARAEPRPGFDVDVPIVLGGALLLAIAVMLVGVIPAWNGARRLGTGTTTRGSAVAGWLAGRGASPQLTTGVRFGLEPGRGSTAVPTRATIIGAVTAIAVATATIVFASSLDRVVNDGRYYGSNFDVALDFEESLSVDEASMNDVVSIVGADAASARVGEMTISEVLVNGLAVTSLAFGDGGDSPRVEPTIAEGDEPVGAGEIALGLTTMRDLHVGIGDTVTMEVDGVESPAHVVGRAVLPGVGLYQGSDRTSIGVGAIVSPESLGPRTGETRSFVLAQLAPGADQDAFERRMSEQLSGYSGVLFQSQGRPSDIEGLARLRSLPVVLSAVLVLLVGVTVVHAMVVAVRRRRRDIAVLQALGSTTGAVTAIGAWQGVTIGVIGSLFGVPLGIIVGRRLWGLLANGFGTLAEPVVPFSGVLLIVATVLVLAALAGVVPVRRGLRHRPAEVLRSE